MPASNTMTAVPSSTQSPLTLLIRFTSLSLVLLLASFAAYASESAAAAYESDDSLESCLPNWSNHSSIAEYNQNNAQNLKLVRHGAAYDLVDEQGAVLYTKLYEIQPYDDDRIVAKRQGKHGVIGSDGQLILEFNYHDILLSPDLSVYSVEILDGNVEGSALIDDKGNWIYPIASKNKTALEAAKDIEVIYPIHANVDTNTSYFQVTVKSYEQYVDKIENTGIIDHTGRIIVPIEYYDIDSEVNCSSNKLLFMHYRNNSVGIIDESGRIVIEESQTHSISVFNDSENLFKLQVYTPESNRSVDRFDRTRLITEKIVNERGETVIESDSSFEKVNGDNEIYRFSIEHKFGLIDDEANIIADPIYDNISNEGIVTPVIKVEKSGKQALIIYDPATDKLITSNYYDNLSKTSYHIPSNLQQLFALSKFSSNKSNDSDSDSVAFTNPKLSSLESKYFANKYGYEYDANALFTFIKNGKQGLVTAHNQVLIPNDYDSIIAYKHLLKVRQGRKYGLRTTYNETVLPITYDDITEDNRINRDGDLFRVKKEGDQGVLDEYGQVVVPLRDMIIPKILNSSLEDILIFEKDGLYGLIEMASGKQLLPAEFEHINITYYTDYILAQKNGNYELYDRFGKLIYRADEDIVKIDTLDTAINLYDLLGFEPKFSVVAKEKYLLIKNKDNLFGLVEETSGHLILPVEYENIQYSATADSLENLRKGIVTSLFSVTKNDQSMLLNKAGEVLVTETKDILNIVPYPPYIITMAEISSDNPVKDKSVFRWNPAEPDLSATGYKMGIIDTSGNEVLAAEYSMLMPYFNGDAVYIYAVKDSIAYRYDANFQLIDTKDVSELEQILKKAWSDE